MTATDTAATSDRLPVRACWLLVLRDGRVLEVRSCPPCDAAELLRRRPDAVRVLVPDSRGAHV